MTGNELEETTVSIPKLPDDFSRRNTLASTEGFALYIHVDRRGRPEMGERTNLIIVRKHI